MSKAAIKVEGLWKEYFVGQRQSQATTFYDLVSNALAKPFRRTHVDDTPSQDDARFWALRDVNFEVQPGEVVGVIGRNGAGKSTLLKVLSRITAPTKGRIEVRGRLASLLEVGTGFHPELSGRENIFLNGAILGMKRAEVMRKFDEIVAFAEVEKFIDTAVKRYSSGMYVRLAFAVAANMETDVLVVDEVLAVGDAEFQRKCLGKMQDVAAHGRTVLFVSHNMTAVSRLCRSCILLESGTKKTMGEVAAVTNAYLRLSVAANGEFPRPGNASLPHVQEITFIDPLSGAETSPTTGTPLCMRVRFFTAESVRNASVVLQISSAAGDLLFFTSSAPDCDVSINFPGGTAYVDVVFDCLLLAAGRYVIGAGLAIPNKEWLSWEPHGPAFDVLPSDFFGSGNAPTYERNRIPLPHRWSQCHSLDLKETCVLT